MGLADQPARPVGGRVPWRSSLFTTPTDRARRSPVVSSACGAIIALCCVLPAAAQATRPAAALDDAPFVVVAPRGLLAPLDEYLAHKRKQMKVEVAVLEEVLAAGTGRDDPEKLKRFLFEAWKERGARYVLLVGDADVLPVRYMVLDRVHQPAFDYAFYPSDLYFADVARPDGSFDDWNARHDDFHAAYFGEVRGEKNKSDPINYDNLDYRPELALGRWPVSTPEEARVVASKTVTYERSLAASGGASRPRAAFVVVGGWVDARGRFDALSKRLPATWRVEKRFYADAADPGAAASAPAATRTVAESGEHRGAAPRNAPGPDEAEIVRLMNEGVRLVLHAGHGQDDRWEHSLSVASLARLHNAEHLPIVLSAGCSTARFATLPPYEAYLDERGAEHKGTNAGEVFTSPPPAPAPYARGAFNRTGLGEQLLRAGPSGAVAYFGCNTGSQPCGLTLLDGFVGTLGRASSPRLGDCWVGAVNHYYDHEALATIRPSESWYPASIFFQGMKFMLFGDPTLIMP